MHRSPYLPDVMSYHSSLQFNLFICLGRVQNKCTIFFFTCIYLWCFLFLMLIIIILDKTSEHNSCRTVCKRPMNEVLNRLVY